MKNVLGSHIGTTRFFSVQANYTAKNSLECRVKWHYNIPLETPIELVIETRYVGNSNNVEPIPGRFATLIINNEDEFKIPYDEYVQLLMPVGIDNEIKSDSPEKLSDTFDFLNEDALLSILSSIGAFEVSNFLMNDDDKDAVTYVRDNKLIQAGLDVEEEALEEEGWVKINEYEHCYLPMSDYIMWGKVDSDDLKIIMY